MAAATCFTFSAVCPMSSSRALDATEAVTNAVVGLVVSWAFTYYALPFWGLRPSPGDALGVTLAFFCLSAARSFALRRLFRGLA